MIELSKNQDLADQEVRAIIFYLTTIGHIDGDFDASERVFVQEYVDQLVRSMAFSAGITDAETLSGFCTSYGKRYLRYFQATDQSIANLFDEAVAADEDLDSFVYSQLKVRCYEIFGSFDDGNQQRLLEVADELILADGVEHPAEVLFRQELTVLLQGKHEDKEIEPATALTPPSSPGHDDQLTVDPEPEDLPLKVQPADVYPRLMENHPLFERLEEHYSIQRARLAAQAASDFELINSAIDNFENQREAGRGKLVEHYNIDEFRDQEPFLDGHVYVVPPKHDREYELIVLGDLHGCYSNLKAALMQSGFVHKVEQFRNDPRNNPEPKLVLLGDYIDRGLFSFNGVLRTVLQLAVAMPGHVYILRGNHEYFLERRGKIISGVLPAEALNTLLDYMPMAQFKAYRRLFNAMPNMLCFGRTLFVHGGIPRTATLKEHYRDLSSLNHKDIRFQMLWSDPSHANAIPDSLQGENARFAFGKSQFQNFMARIGCNTMIRGHEKVDEGVEVVYDMGDTLLMTLFSAGGRYNNDLPERSSYRTVTPMALSIHHKNGVQTATPWAIDYQHYNTQDRNAFFRASPEIPFKAR